MLNYNELAEKAMAKPGGLVIQSRPHRFYTYHNCFIGKDFVKWLKNNGYSSDEYDS